MNPGLNDLRPRVFNFSIKKTYPNGSGKARLPFCDVSSGWQSLIGSAEERSGYVEGVVTQKLGQGLARVTHFFPNTCR